VLFKTLDCSRGGVEQVGYSAENQFHVRKVSFFCKNPSEPTVESTDYARVVEMLYP
jgi:hypothetical protein